MARGVSAKAEAAERAAFDKVGKLLKGKAIVSPAGFDAGFPDFGYRIDLTNGNTIDLHFEYKADYKAQMGSMRDWIFDGTKFTTKAIDDVDKELMLQSMNNNSEIMSNAKRLYKDFNDVAKEMGYGKVPVLSSGLLSSISRDFKERKEFTKAVIDRTKKQQMGSVKGGFGQSLINFYKKKFR